MLGNVLLLLLLIVLVGVATLIIGTMLWEQFHRDKSEKDR